MEDHQVSRLSVLPLCLCLLVACGGDGAGGAGDGTEVARTYSPQLSIDLNLMERQPSGLYIEDIHDGEGEPVQPGDIAFVHYTGWLPDGREFDSSRGGERGPLAVVVGRGEVIAGWDEGLQGMRAGSRRRLVIPPALAYGSRGAGGVIPPDATLVFDVQIVEIRRN
jgi:FKBP-type peptidyl-prolyl cis-trans isomerase FkpA